MKRYPTLAIRLMRCALTLLMTIVLHSALLAQLSESVTEICDVVHPIGWVRFKENVNIQGDRVFQQNASLFGLGERDEMRLIRTWNDGLGSSHYRYQQYLDGVPIEHAIFTIHAKDGRAKKGNGRIAAYVGLSGMPTFTKQLALELAIKALPHGTPAWLDEASERFLKSIRGDSTISQFPDPRLTITRRDAEGAFTDDNLVLTYMVELSTVKPTDAFVFYVNATDGSILKVQRQKTGCTGSTATATTLYNGEKAITVTGTGSDYVLETSCSYGNFPNIKTTHIVTKSIDNFLLYEPTQNSIVHSDLDWTDDSDLDPYVQAHWSGMMTYEYFKESHKFADYDGVGGTMLHLVGGLDEPNWYQNYLAVALPDHSDTRFEGKLIDWPVSLDIVGHEWTHAITHTLTDLTGTPSGEFGALYESFGDIFGSLVECYAKAIYDPSNPNDCEDFIMGEESIAPDYQRNMVNPHSKSHPDTYCGTFWEDNRYSLHARGGVQNWWFTLLAKQKDDQNNPWTGENNHCCKPETYSVTPIGKVKAATVAFRNLRDYIGPYSNYVDAMLGSLEAADDLIGTNPPELTSTDKAQIVAAWKAVGVYANKVGYDFVRCITYTSTSEETLLEAINSIRAGTLCGAESANVVESGATLSYIAGKEVKLQSGFIAKAGCEFTARIVEPCTTFFFPKSHAIRPAIPGVPLAGGFSAAFAQNAPTLFVAPNPVQDDGKLWFSLTSPSNVRLMLVDHLGRPAFMLLDGVQFSSGKHQVAVSYSNLASGSYLCVLEAAGHVVTTIVQVLR